MLSIVQKLNALVKDKMPRFVYFVIILSEFRSQESGVRIQKKKCRLNAFTQQNRGSGEGLSDVGRG